MIYLWLQNFICLVQSHSPVLLNSNQIRAVRSESEGQQYDQMQIECLEIFIRYIIKDVFLLRLFVWGSGAVSIKRVWTYPNDLSSLALSLSLFSVLFWPPSPAPKARTVNRHGLSRGEKFFWKGWLAVFAPENQGMRSTMPSGLRQHVDIRCFLQWKPSAKKTLNSTNFTALESWINFLYNYMIISLSSDHNRRNGNSLKLAERSKPSTRSNSRPRGLQKWTKNEKKHFFQGIPQRCSHVPVGDGSGEVTPGVRESVETS